MSKTHRRKRPCRICRRWFLPDPRLKERQMTCGKAYCQREWHKKKCAEWNRKNRDYFKANYLQKKIDAATQCRGDPEAALPGTIVARTKEITRAIVEIRTPISPADISVSLPNEKTIAKSTRRKRIQKLGNFE